MADGERGLAGQILDALADAAWTHGVTAKHTHVRRIFLAAGPLRHETQSWTFSRELVVGRRFPYGDEIEHAIRIAAVPLRRLYQLWLWNCPP